VPTENSAEVVESLRSGQYAILERHDSAVGIVDANDLIGAFQRILAEGRRQGFRTIPGTREAYCDEPLVRLIVEHDFLEADERFDSDRCALASRQEVDPSCLNPRLAKFRPLLWPFMVVVDKAVPFSHISLK
jgi:hypothetical protein